MGSKSEKQKLDRSKKSRLDDTNADLSSIKPLNLSAQLAYHGVGNPPSAHPSQAISNCFPGLESDFRNVWRRIFVGLTMQEADTVVVSVDDDQPDEIKRLANRRLLTIDEQDVFVIVKGPRAVDDPGQGFPEAQGPVVPLPPSDSKNAGLSGMEWSNALAQVLSKAGERVKCAFEGDGAKQPIFVDLEIRSFFEDEKVDGSRVAPRAVISRKLVQPGELTQSLCSPWQNDYRECACYYWAASRPDYINVEPGPEGISTGHNWLQKDRSPGAPRNYSLDDSKLFDYNDLFRNWEKLLKFQVGGKDEE